MANKASSGSFSKASVIREALDKGIDSPAAISAFAKQSKGLDLDPKYVSVIKSQIRARLRGKGLGRGGRDTRKEASLFALKCGSIDKAKKALEGVRSDPILAFAVAMGGVDRAVGALNDVASHLSID